METELLLEVAKNIELNKRGRVFGSIGDVNVCLSRFSNHPRWEIHPLADEVLVGVQGELELHILSDTENKSMVLRAGEVVVVPANTWHSPIPLGEVSVLSISNYLETRVSNLDDPRS